MHETALGEFISAHREEILRRCRAREATLSSPATTANPARSIPWFLADIVDELHGVSKADDIDARAAELGADLFWDGVTSVGQVVHTYGAVCESVIDLAVETHTAIAAEDYRTLNRCVDEAIAGAVAEYARQQKDEEHSHALSGSRIVKTLIATAIDGFEALQSGSVPVSGPTGRRVLENLLAVRDQANEMSRQ